MSKRKRQYGFTLVEALVAAVILSGAVMTLAGLSSRCLSRTRFNQEYEQAWQVLDRQLTLIDMMGIDEFVNEGITEGEISGLEREEQPRYRWQADIQSEPDDYLYRITMRVEWRLDHTWHTISACAMFDGQGRGRLPEESQPNAENQQNQQNRNPDK